MKVFSILLFCLTTLSSYSQSFDWEIYSPFGSYKKHDINYAIKSDNEGNIYSASYFKDSVSVDGQLLYADKFNQDLVIIKYNKHRELVWYKEIDLNHSNHYLGFDLDSNGDLIIASSMSDTLVIDNFTIEPETEKSGFIAKINKSGNTEWVKKIFNGYPTIHFLNLSNNDDIFVSGKSWHGGFLARLDKLGNTIWKWDIKSPGGGSNVWGSDIKLAPDGSTFGVLMFQSQQINVSQDITLLNPYSWGIQMVLFKFDSAGEIVWYSQNTQGRFLEDVKFEIDNLSNIYLAGSFHNAPLQLGDLELPIPPNNKSYGFISKCNSAGQWEWLTQRDPWPNLSNNIEFDCQNEVIYSTGLRSLEVFSTLGNLENQLLFNEDITRCFSLDIGINNNILLSGVTKDSIIGNGNFNWNNPYIVSIDYNSMISNKECITTSELNDNHFEQNIRVYPTIIKDEITIQINNKYTSNLKLIISTINGNKLHEENIQSKHLDKTIIPTNHLPAGCYILSIISNYGVSSKKIFKVH